MDYVPSRKVGFCRSRVPSKLTEDSLEISYWEFSLKFPPKNIISLGSDMCNLISKETRMKLY